MTDFSTARPNARKRFSGVVGSMTLVNALVLGLGIITGPLQARALAPEGRGELAAIVAPLALAPYLVGLGIDGYVARAVARRQRLVDVLGASVVIVLACSAVGVALAYPLALLLGHGRATVERFILIGLLLLPLNAIVLVLRGVVWGRQDWRLWICLRVAPPLLFLTAIAALYAAGALTVATAATAVLASSLVGAMPLLIVFRRTWPWRFDGRTAREAVSFGSRTWLATVVHSANLRLDQVLMAPLVPSRQLGLYAVAVTVASYSTAFTSAVNTVLYPRVAEGETMVIVRAVRVIFFGLGIINVMVAVAAPPLIKALFGSAFQDAVPMIWLLLVADVFLAAASVLAIGIAADGAPGSVARAEAVSLSVTMPVLLILLPSTGGLGAAGISIGTYAISYVLLLRSARRRFGGRYRDYLVPTRRDAVWARDVLRHRRLVDQRSIASS